MSVFLGYSAEHKGYRCWDLVGRWMRISRDVTFDESRPFYSCPPPDASHSSFVEPLSFLTIPDTPIAPMHFPHLVPASAAPDEPLMVPSSASPSSVEPSSSDSTPHVPMGTIYDTKPPVTRFYV